MMLKILLPILLCLMAFLYVDAGAAALTPCTKKFTNNSTPATLIPETDPPRWKYMVDITVAPCMLEPGHYISDQQVDDRAYIKHLGWSQWYENSIEWLLLQCSFKASHGDTILQVQYRFTWTCRHSSDGSVCGTHSKILVISIPSVMGDTSCQKIMTTLKLKTSRSSMKLDMRGWTFSCVSSLRPKRRSLTSKRS